MTGLTAVSGSNQQEFAGGRFDAPTRLPGHAQTSRYLTLKEWYLISKVVAPGSASCGAQTPQNVH